MTDPAPCSPHPAPFHQCPAPQRATITIEDVPGSRAAYRTFVTFSPTIDMTRPPDSIAVRAILHFLDQLCPADIPPRDL